MALASEDRKAVWSARTVAELRERSIFYNLMDRSWETEWVNGAKSVDIPKPNWTHNTTPSPDEGVGSSDRARGGNWATEAEPDQSIVQLTRSGGKASTNKIDWEEATEIPWPIVDRHRSRQSYTIAHDIDTAMYDAARALPSMTITGGTDGDTFVENSAPYDYTIATGKRHPVAQVVDQIALIVYRANAVLSAASPTAQVGTPVLVISPELCLSFSIWLEEKGLGFDPLTREILRDNPANFNGMDIAGRYHGVDIIGWNHIGVPGGNNNWSGYAAIPEAYAVGIRPALSQYWDPANNQISSNPAHLIRSVADWAGVEVEDAWHRKVDIKSD